MLDANALAAMGIGPACDVAGREDVRSARFEIGVYHDAAIDAEPCRFGELGSWAYADADDDEIRLQLGAALELDPFAVDGAGRILQMEDHAVLFVQRAYEVAHLWTHDPFHRPFLRRDDMGFDAARPKGSRAFEPDEACAQDDHATRRLGTRNDGAAVAERAQCMDVRLVGSRDRQSDRFGAGREQQAVEWDLAAVSQNDFTGARIDARNMRLKTQIDGVIGIIAVGTQRHPILRRGAREVILGKVWPIDGRRIVVAEHDEAAAVSRTPQSLGRGESGCPTADDDDLFRHGA